MANRKPKITVKINGQQQRQRSSHNNNQQYGSVVEVKQTAPRLVLNPFDTTGRIRQEIYITGK